MAGKRSLRKSSNSLEGEEFKTLFDEFTIKTTETITLTVKKILEEKLEGLEKKLDKKLDIIEKRLKTEIQEVKKQTEEYEKRREEDEDRLTFLELKEKEHFIRIRGVEEDKEENIKNIKKLLVHMIADLIDWEEEKVGEEIEKIYRVNSKYARVNKKPRDILIEFSKKKYRDVVIQAAFKKKIEVEGKSVTIFKEVPGRILKKRKEYKFLTDLLKKNEINFRWEVVEGINLQYKGQRHRLTSVFKAKEFYKKLEKELGEKKEQVEGQE